MAEENFVGALLMKVFIHFSNESWQKMAAQVTTLSIEDDILIESQTSNAIRENCRFSEGV